MTKQELMENYTMEQLAEMVVDLQKENLIEILKLKNREDTEDVQKVIDAMRITITELCNTIENLKGETVAKWTEKENYKIGIITKCPDCGKENKFDLDEKTEKLIRNRLTDKIHNLEDENKWLKDEVHKQKNIIDLIDDILENLFGVRHDVGKPNEFEEILKEKIYGNITIEDFLPEEPIKVADILINSTYTREKGDIEKIIHKAFGNDSDTVIENMYSVSELRQIAEHLLVYCNANQEDQP